MGPRYEKGYTQRKNVETHKNEGNGPVYLIYYPKQKSQDNRPLGVEVQPHARAAELARVATARHLALALGDVGSRGGAGVAGPVELVVTPALAAVLETCVVVVVAHGEAGLDRHGLGIGHQVDQETALGRLRHAVVTGASEELVEVLELLLDEDLLDDEELLEVVVGVALLEVELVVDVDETVDEELRLELELEVEVEETVDDELDDDDEVVLVTELELELLDELDELVEVDDGELVEELLDELLEDEDEDELELELEDEVKVEEDELELSWSWSWS
ncbi:uncharacterized protein E0L32_007776 [Thyridium curvatum]|uniref:Uncharacterized protein n=1 Tax=Thyridium curvatum TaxID=1093900 RepID=A0A507ALQ6_9PEZI|nr:uncharacterized protein E0L32_007776 [Thyridium curvatum]TPX11565.1 hypothetical protein E0L32_007776 [Thyridium curvatum]